MKNMKVEGIKEFLKEAENNPQVFKKNMKVAVEWNMDDNKPQMTSKVEFVKGSASLESDQAPFMGGEGRAPNPIQYCLFGMAACFAATFAAIAVEKGLEAKSFMVTAENKVNLKKAYGLSGDPIVEKVFLNIEIKSNADRGKIEEVKELALERCPGVYCLTKTIPLESNINIS